MDSFSDLVRARRSIRSYSGRVIDQKDLDKCAEAARYAPSACNSQPWKFIIVNDSAVKKDIANKVFSGIYSMNSFAADAAAYIVIVSERTKLAASVAGALIRTDFGQIDLGIAYSHISLQAQALGIGSCALGWFDSKALKRILRIPHATSAGLIVALGYSSGCVLPERKLKDRCRTISLNHY
ncbi:MAG: nitroreductase family protein [Candidatus Omnitrophota bacterium]|nr:nitroreductase family protein [Candidatus Omnitrophota bacterium]